MKYINIFYIIIFIIGIYLWRLNTFYQKEVVLFYGFAENNETEINFNYPIMVERIYVRPGQKVKKGDILLNISKINPSEALEDQPFRIAELQAKQRAWLHEKQGTLALLRKEKELRLGAIEADISKLKEERDFQKSLYRGLKSVEKTKSTYLPISKKIEALEKEKALERRRFDQKINNIKKEIRLGINPYEEEIKRLNAEQDFEEQNKSIKIQLTAPTDGLVGNIYCKEAEHIPSFKTLVSFYEPNPSLVKGFVQEDLILHVALNDSFLVRSTKDATIYCIGKVIGLGSRIVEIPDRLRKIPNIKTYGREVMVSIPINNNFLQKEKVILEFINQPATLTEQIKPTPMVDLKVREE